MSWKPWLSAVPDDNGTHFRVWAPRARSLEVRIVGGPTARLRADEDGYAVAYLEGVRPGARYLYRFPDGRERPDPASLLQPEGVHGPSEVVDLGAIRPRSRPPKVPLERLIFSEIHLGTFTPEGTAQAAARRMGDLADALFTAVEVMPVATFPGARNWGYDGVGLFAAHAAYGGPAGLAKLVEAAHEAGLRAFLDVVYNHLGPEGNYLAEFGPYFTDRHKTPWGDALNFDGRDAGPVRRFFVENALRWTSANGAGFDGLRLDAVHSLVDDSPKHILQEIREAVRAERPDAHLIAESDLNDPKLIEGYGLDATWADELHHGLHVALTGEKSGYYADFAPPALDPLDVVVTALRQGWHYGGVYKPSFKKVHGAPAGHLRGRHFVVGAQNHDQIGNRARGERLVELTGEDGARLAAALIALQPALPMYFQGEEWGARQPFLYFVSHEDQALLEAVRKGRREEFKGFAWAAEVPDPGSEETFARSRIDWSERKGPLLEWHKQLLRLRREHPALRDDARAALGVWRDGNLLYLRRGNLLLVLAFGPGAPKLPPGPYRVLLDSAGEKTVPERIEGKRALVLERT